MRSRELLELAPAPDARGEDGDLLAAPAGDDVGGAQALGEAAHDLDQDLVADPVAEPVVDRLEPVEVDEEQPRRHGRRGRRGSARRSSPPRTRGGWERR